MKLVSRLPDPIKKRLRRHKLVFDRLSDWVQLQSKTAYWRLRHRFIAGPRLPQNDGKVYLHLGCGAVDHEKFINIDKYPFPHVHFVQSIDRLPQFDDASVDLIYASHCLEHFSYTRTDEVLSEWRRVLRRGAILRLSVPDFDKLVQIYALHDKDPDVILPQLMGGQNNKYNFHLTALNIVNLSRLLRAAGFVETREWQPGADDLTTFNDFSIYKKEIAGEAYGISLNIEAVK